jgi:GNAT superfamily N-acetyltransferase
MGSRGAYESLRRRQHPQILRTRSLPTDAIDKRDHSDQLCGSLPAEGPRAVQFFKDFHSEEKIADRSKNGTTLVVEEDGELVATGSLVHGEILAVFVHPRLQKGGRGKVLLKALENEARASGVTEIGLSISLSSKRFYESLGYKVVEEISRDVGEGQRLDFWKAVKQLPKS